MSPSGQLGEDVDRIEVIDLVSSTPPSPAPVANGQKRKAKGHSPDDNDNDIRDKKSKVSPALVELHGRKLVFVQAPLDRPQSYTRGLMELQMEILRAKMANKPLTELPKQYWNLVAMAGHELASATEPSFRKAIKAELLKGEGDGSGGPDVPADLLTDPVKAIFTLKQYGFVSADFGAGQTRIPAGLQIRCWEADEKYLPAENLTALVERRVERERARAECVKLAANMDDIEKHDLLKGDKGKDDAPATTKVKPAVAAPPRSREATPKPSSSRQRTTSPVKKAKTTEDETVAKRKQEEKDAKAAAKEVKRKEKAEREEKKEEKRRAMELLKASKEKEEKKKAATHAKQSQLMSTFFSAKKNAKAGPSNLNGPVTSPAKSGGNDFERMFPPPPQRANVRWMPISNWKHSSNAKQNESVEGWSPRDFINDHLSRHNIPAQRTRPRHPNGLKTAPLFGAVAAAYAEYQSAEDPRAVRRRLLNTDKYPRKILAFHHHARPPYTGTFTKASLVVGPRTPLAHDPYFDYSIDSGDEWEEDEGGDDVDAAGEQDAEADEDVSEDGADGEFDDWLDNEHDDLFGPNASGALPFEGSPPPLPSAASAKPKLPVKRVTKLDQDCQGPFWERCIGHHPHEELNEYRIQLLNDAPSNLDPFKYQSAEAVCDFKATFSDTAVGQQVGVKCLLTTTEMEPRKPKTTSAVPAAMPLGDASSSANINTTPANTLNTSTHNVNTLTARRAKISFPTDRVGELLDAIEGSSKIRSDLVLDLRNLFTSVTKGAIEAKLREVAVREGKGKDAKWLVKDEAWTKAGRTPPVRGLMTHFGDR